MMNWVMSLIVSAVLLTGGTIQREIPPCRVVTAVTIRWHNGTEIATRQYTNPEDMRRVLNYLRHLQPFPAREEPDHTAGAEYDICLSLSDGTDTHYTQKGITFLQKSGEGWQVLDPDQGIRLRLILAAVPGDLDRH